MTLSFRCSHFSFLFANLAASVLHSSSTTSESRSIADSLKNAKPDIPWSLSFAKIFWAVIILTLAFLVIRYLAKILESLAEQWPRFRLTIKGFIPIVRIVGWTAVLYFTLVGIFAPPIETLVALTASAGIAVGFASQDILKNIFGGIVILFDHPFQVGDKIQVGDHYGEVIHIGLRTVRIVTPDDSTVSIPNAEIVNQSVSNANSGASHCQVVASFYLPADIDLPAVKHVLLRTAAVSRYAYLRKPIAIVVRNEVHHGRSILKLSLKAYVLDLRFEFPFLTEMTEVGMKELIQKGLVSPDRLEPVNRA